MIPGTVAHQAPLPMRFPRQECWCGLLFPSPGDLPDHGIEPMSPALASGFYNFSFLWVKLSLPRWKPQNKRFQFLMRPCWAPNHPASTGLLVFCWCQQTGEHLGTVFPHTFISTRTVSWTTEIYVWLQPDLDPNTPPNKVREKRKTLHLENQITLGGKRVFLL